MTSFEHAGWFIPGNLKSGWAETYQTNFNDLRVKMAQLGLESLVGGVGNEADLGFYFSQARYDFIQLLTGAEGSFAQSARRMVAYSLWFSSQGWGSFSPVPLLRARSDESSNLETEAPLPGDYENNPVGWYLIAAFKSEWYRGTGENLRLAGEKRRELGLRDLSPFYSTQSSEFEGLQLLQAEPERGRVRDLFRGDGDAGRMVETMPDNGVMKYVEWFGERGFGSLRVTPFMSTNLVSAAILLAGRNP